MSRGAQEKVKMPVGWWDKLRAQYEAWDYTLESFCADIPTLSSKTLYRAKASGWMNTDSLSLLAKKLDFSTQSELIAEWEGRAPGILVKRLDAAESIEMERRYVALSRVGLYDVAAALAQNSLAGAELAKNKPLMAHWADLLADAYRAIGRLRDASAFYAKAWAYAQNALTESPNDIDVRYQVGKTRFGQIMVDAYLMRGAFGEAYRCHEQLLRDVDLLLKDVGSDSLSADIRLRRVHIRRQQAEMLRYLGHYSEALTLIREVLEEYPPSAYEPRSYARLSEADSLRLQGDGDAPLRTYLELEQTARGRDLPGLLGAVLWRKSCLLHRLERRDERQACLDELTLLAKANFARYRFMVIYSLLTRVSGQVADGKEAKKILQEAEDFGPLRPDYLVVEYAHAALCRGEILRQIGRAGEARGWFQKASDCYVRTECRWGVVRAWIGLRLTGGDVAFPKRLKRSLQGADAALLADCESGHRIEPGVLSMNIP